MSYSYEEIRATALDILSGRETTSYRPYHYVHLRLGVAEVLSRRHPQATIQAGSQPKLDRPDSDIFLEVFWDLFRQGIITLGVDDSNPNFPFCRISQLGRRILEGQNPYLFHDVSTYEALIRESVPEIDSVTLTYLQEAMQAFKAGCILSSTVMLGVATEHTFNLLVEEVDKKDPFKTTFASVSRQKTILQKVNKFKNILDQNLKLFPPEIKEDLDTYFAGILSVIRNFRNQSGHPTGRVVGREQAYVLLQLFIPYCQKIYDLRKFIRESAA